MYQSTFSMAASSSFGMGAKELGFLQVLIFFWLVKKYNY
jgi:hypothetical protein